MKSLSTAECSFHIIRSSIFSFLWQIYCYTPICTSIPVHRIRRYRKRTLPPKSRPDSVAIVWENNWKRIEIPTEIKSPMHHRIVVRTVCSGITSENRPMDICWSQRNPSTRKSAPQRFKLVFVVFWCAKSRNWLPMRPLKFKPDFVDSVPVNNWKLWKIDFLCALVCCHRNRNDKTP